MRREEFLDALLSLPRLGDWSQVSPDGRWVAWTRLQVGPAADVGIAPPDGSQGPRRLPGTPDGRTLIVEEDRGGNERYRLFRVPLDNADRLVEFFEEAFRERKP